MIEIECRQSRLWSDRANGMILGVWHFTNKFNSAHMLSAGPFREDRPEVGQAFQPVIL